MWNQRVRLIGQVGLATALLCSAPGALAQQREEPSAEACLKSHERSQVTRLEAELLQARAELRQCSHAVCPSVVRSDCTEWLSEVQRLIPSIVLVVQSDSGDEKDVRVFIDGDLLTEKLDGKAIEVNPGAHQLRFELEGWPAQNKRVIIREGEKHRVIEARFEKEKPPTPVAPVFYPTPDGQPAGPRPVPTATYVFGALALAAAGGGTYLGVTTLDEYDKAKAECGPGCPQSRVDEIRLRATLADVSFGVAGVSALIATYFYLTRPVVLEKKKPEPKKNEKPAAPKKADRRLPQLGVALGRSGGLISLGGAF